MEPESEPELESEWASCAPDAAAVMARMAQVVAAAKAEPPTSPAMEEPEEPSETRLELPPPR